MDNINIDSSIGNVAVLLAATLKDSDKANKLAALHLLHHASASKAFNKKAKDAGIERETPFSDALSAHVEKAIREVFAPIFDITSLVLSKAADKLSGEEKLVRDMMKEFGLDEATARQMVAQAKAAKAAKSEATKPEAAPAASQPAESVN